MIVKTIQDPSPVWDEIKNQLSDGNGFLIPEGDFAGVFYGGDMIGAFLIKPWSTYCYEIHGGVHPSFWGRGPEVCWNLGDMIFRVTPCLKIVAIIPEYNRLMRRCVKLAGLKREGTIKNGWLKWSALHDLVIYGISKREKMPCPERRQ